MKSQRHAVFEHLILVAVVFLVAIACLIFTREMGRIAAVWPVNAVVLAMVLRRPLRNWAGLILAGSLGDLAANLEIDRLLDAATHGGRLAW